MAPRENPGFPVMLRPPGDYLCAKNKRFKSNFQKALFRYGRTGFTVSEIVLTTDGVANAVTSWLAASKKKEAKPVRAGYGH